MGLEASCRHVGMIHSADRLWWFFTLFVLVLVLPNCCPPPIHFWYILFNWLISPSICRKGGKRRPYLRSPFFLSGGVPQSSQYNFTHSSITAWSLIFDLDLVLTLKIFSKYGMNLIQSFQLSRCEFESTSVPRPFLFCPLSLHVHGYRSQPYR